MTDNEELQIEIRNLYYITGALTGAIDTLPAPQRQTAIEQLQAQANEAPPGARESMKALLESLENNE